MNAITRAGSGAIAIPAHLPLPELPDAVALYLAAVEEHKRSRSRFYAAAPEDREGMWVGAVPSRPALANSERGACERAAAHLANAMAPVSRQLFRAWLRPINAAVRNPQGEEEFEGRCLAMHALLDDLPSGCFTSDARRYLPGFFPSAADIRSAVEPDARKLRQAADALAAAMAPPREVAPQAEAPRGPRTIEEITAARAKVQEAVAHFRQVAEDRDAARPKAQPVRAVPLSEGALLAQYDRMAREGNAAAGMRAQALRARLGVAT